MSIITMITVGYGDIIPVNRTERMFAIFTALVSCGVFAYTFNEIGNIFRTLTQTDEEFRNNMIILQEHMSSKHVHANLMMRAKKYFEYLHEEEQSNKE